MKARKISRKAYIKKLDDLVSIMIRQRDQKCVICGSTDNLTNGHVFSRKNYSLRWDLRTDGNCHCQCWPCNFKHVKDTVPYFNWYIDTFGKDRFDQLYMEWNKTTQMKDWQLEELLGNLKLEGEHGNLS